MPLPQPLSKLKSRLVRAAGPIGLYQLAWRLSRQRPRIFMYHRFAKQDTAHKLGRETFRAQIKLIKRCCRIVTMGELAEVLRERPDTAGGLAVITVDDGYKDFYDHAWPVLREEGAPATFFPVTGFLDRELWLWPDLVQFALDKTQRRTVSSKDLRLQGESTFELDLETSQRMAWQALIDAAIDLPDAEKWMFLQDLFAGLGVAWPEAIPEQYGPVSWDELRAMAGSGIEIGAHTYSHCRLPRAEASDLPKELDEPRVRLESEIQRPVVSLCYPNGSPQDYDSQVITAAERAGYRSAVTSFFDGRVGGMYELRRHGVGPDMFHFSKCLWGIEDLAYRGGLE